MNEHQFIVIDTNILISAILFPNSLIAKAVDKAFLYYEPCVCHETLGEFLEVINRPKFDKYFVGRPYDKTWFISNFVKSVIVIEPTETVVDCKDPKDNKFLAVALSANARFLVTGDKKNLLSMNPYRGIEIITAKEFLEKN